MTLLPDITEQVYASKCGLSIMPLHTSLLHLQQALLTAGVGYTVCVYTACRPHDVASVPLHGGYKVLSHSSAIAIATTLLPLPPLQLGLLLRWLAPPQDEGAAAVAASTAQSMSAVAAEVYRLVLLGHPRGCKLIVQIRHVGLSSTGTGVDLISLLSSPFAALH